MRTLHGLRVLWILLLAVWMVGPASAFEVEAFDAGLGGWTGYPQRIGTSTTPGWTTSSFNGDVAAVTNPTATKSTYYWRLTSGVDLTGATQPSLVGRVELLAGYASLTVEIANANAAVTDPFTVLWETTAAGAGPVDVNVPLDAYVGQVRTLRVSLKKAYGVVASGPGARVYELGVAVPPPPPPPPDPIIVSVGAFNAQVFGLSKMATVGVPEAIVATMGRYDLVLLQEVRDASGASLLDLEARLDATGVGWTVVASNRLGRTRSKEQYAYIFREDRLKLLDTYHYEDGLEPSMDQFEREPFVARFATLDDAYTFVTIPLHAAPEDAPVELSFLGDVEVDALDAWGDPNILMLGDFNASCTYLTPREMAALPTRTDPSYAWWIDDAADTTTTSTLCAYDRLVTHGDLTSRVVEGSAAPFLFDRALGLGTDLTRRVSDHYPVELLLELPVLAGP